MADAWDTTGYESKDDLDGYQYPKEGVYHLAIQEADHESERAKNAKGLRITFEVLSGTMPGQEGLTFTQTYKWPSSDHKDKGEFARKMITRIMLTTGYIHESQLGGKIPTEWADLAGRQLVAKIKNYKRTAENGPRKGETFEGTEIDGMHFWHVNDEDAASVPKDAEALELRPADAEPVGGSGGKGELVGAGAAAASSANGTNAPKDKFANL